jgi:pilus assembly protein CpaF
MADSARLEIDFGPLQKLVDDDAVYQIMVNGPDRVYVERRGHKLDKEEVPFRDNEHVVELINSLLASVKPNVQVSPDHPCADARFPDGSRMQAFISPVAVSGPSLTIRKVTKHVATFDDILSWVTLSEDMADFLKACVKARLNIIVSGNRGGGKTTLLNILASAIPAEERVISVEEVTELRVKHEHLIVLEHRPPDWEGKGEISVKDLLHMAARARPDRLLIGELSGSEALEMLRLADRGHEGTMTTLLANSPQEALERLEMMVKMSEPNLPVSYLRLLIGAAIDLVVQQNRLEEDGNRKVVRITEVLPVRGGDYELHDVFVFQREGLDEQGKVVGHFESHPISSDLKRRIEASGSIATLPPVLIPAEEEPAGEAAVT